MLKNLRHVFASGNSEDYPVPDNALVSFLEHCSKQIGDAYFRTPRNTIKAFVDMLEVLQQNSQIAWQELVGSIDIKKEYISNMPDTTDTGEQLPELTSFQL